MKKKKSLIGIFLLLLVAAVGVTFAYYTSNTSFVNLFNTGKYKVKVVEEFVSPDNWVPGETIPKTVTAKNEGNVDAAVRISYVEKWETLEGADITNQVNPNPAIINFTNTNDWILSNGHYYYKYILGTNDITSSFISGVTLDPSLDSVTCTGEGNERTCESRSLATGAKYKLTFTIETAQADKYKEIWNTDVVIEDKPDNVIVFPTGKDKDTLEVGDEVCVYGISTECFNFVRYDENDDLVLLAKYNLKVGNVYSEGQYDVSVTHRLNSSDEGYGLQFNEQVVIEDNHATVTGGVAFSKNAYWSDGSNLLSKYGNSYPANVYDSDYATAPDFSANGWQTEGYSIAYYVEEYKDTLESYGASIKEARLLYVDEATIPGIDCDLDEFSCPSTGFIGNTFFYLGSAYNDERVMYIFSQDSDVYMMTIAPTHDMYFGVRPVIVIDKDNV